VSSNGLDAAARCGSKLRGRGEVTFAMSFLFVATASVSATIFNSNHDSAKLNGGKAKY